MGGANSTMLEDPEREGSLQKQSDHLRDWRTRFFRIQGHLLEYYDDQAAAAGAAKGFLDLDRATVRELLPSGSQPGFDFQLLVRESQVRALGRCCRCVLVITVFHEL